MYIYVEEGTVHGRLKGELSIKYIGI